ncbi:MAG: discoidin domain-containing protein [Pseudomonadota bacterium]
MVALAATSLLAAGCGAPAPDDMAENDVGSESAALTLTLTTTSTYALASGAMSSVTVSGGTGSYSCAITNNVSGGASCSVSGGVISYTAGSTAGFNMKSERTNDYLKFVAGTGGPYLETGAAIGAAELFKFFVVGSGFKFQAKSNGNYVRNAGTVSAGDNLVADTAVGTADVFAMQNCNGAGDSGLYNRFGFSSATGTLPYWKAQTPPYIDAVFNGNATACDPTLGGRYEAFFLSPGIDTLTITDTGSNTGTLSVSVEPPIAFLPASTATAKSTAISTVQTWGGSGIFTGGSSACTVTTNNSGGGACSVTGYGAVSYTAGSTIGTDTIRITDSQGHTGTFTVSVTATPLAMSTTSTNALASSAMPAVTVSGGTGPYNCAVASNTSGGASCSMSGSTVTYTPGSRAGYYIRLNRTNDYLYLQAASGGPYIINGGALGSTAEFFKMAASGAGFTFQAKSSGLYLRSAGTISTGNDVVADGGSADVYTMQDCNGTGDPGRYNRFGFASASGTSPYWNSPGVHLDTVNNGNGAACDPTVSLSTRAYFLEPGTDTLTIGDSASHTNTLTVTVENPVAFMPASAAAGVSTAISAQTWGGSGVFSSCSVTTNNSGGSTCTVTSSGGVSYTTGASGGTDTIRVTDSQGHTGTFNVVVTQPFVVSSTTSYALAASAIGQSITVTGGTAPYTCTVATSSSGAATCSVSGGVVTYTAGATSGYNIANSGSGDYLRLVAGSGGPYVRTGGAVGSSAELFKIALLGSGYTFQANSSGNYVRHAGTVSTGNDLVADATVATAGLYAIQNCSGAGSFGNWNRFGFKSLSGSAPYWQWKSPTSYIDTAGNGFTTPCDTRYGARWEGFYLWPGVDVLTISDSASNSAMLTISVETPIKFQRSVFDVSTSSAIVTQALGGSVTFTGGSAGCAVTTNNSASGGTCSVTAWGLVSYTAGATTGTDTLTVTDSQGHTGTITVNAGITPTQISPGPNYFGCARTSNSTARCWGYNANGELGNGTISTYSATPVTVSGLSTVTAVTTGENHACALLANNTVRCWGDNSLGQLGNGTLTDSSTPVTVTGISDATAISAGMVHTCALRSGGTVVCWGYNASAQIGNATAPYWPNATTPAAVTGLSSVSAISSGGFHTCALSSGGGVSCWGDNSIGQLGNGGSPTKSFAPVAVTGLTSGVSSVSGGEQHTCAVVSAAVKCWGDNSYGQLGNNSTANANTPVSVSSISTAAQVAAGYVFSCARLTTNAVKCWGRNTEGELGDTTSTNSLVPVSVSGVSTANGLSAGGVNACVTLSSGLASCWGYNGYGEVADGTATDAHQPISVSLGGYGSGLPSDLSSGGTGTASTAPVGGEQGPQAFDNDPTTKWYSGGGSGTTGWLAYHFTGTTTHFATSYAVTSANDVPGRDPSAWQFQGSTDGSAWTTLDTRSTQSFTNRYQTKFYTLDNNTAYNYYRLNITGNNGGTELQLSEFQLYGE